MLRRARTGRPTEDTTVKCPGKGICEHGEGAKQVQECGGSGICGTGERTQCKECGGGSICEHGRCKQV